jgi:ubiquinone/menaquinone biosynthesis C-methylase UbiE
VSHLTEPPEDFWGTHCERVKPQETQTRSMTVTAQFFESLANGRLNTADEWQEYLHAFHSEFPHANELFTLMHRWSGDTSYGAVAKAIDAAGAQRVLDLGCGDGNLIDELLSALPKAASIVGIDACAPEIELSRRRYEAEPRVRFEISDARHLPFADASFDAVAAHQVLNLFPEIHPVLAETARVLRPQGELVVAANRGWRKDQDATWQLLNAAALDVIKRAHPNFVWPLMGDMRIYSEDGVLQIFEESGLWNMHTLSIETFNTRAILTPHQIAAIYNRLYLYATSPHRQHVLKAVEARATELSSRGILEIDLPFRLIKIQKANGHETAMRLPAVDFRASLTKRSPR